MSLLGDGPHSGEVGQVAKSLESCKPDYQKMASELKIRMEKKRALLDALEVCLSEGLISSYKASNSTTLYEVLGVLQIEEVQLSGEYEKLLKKVEEEKADGTKES
jgi:hypothetical protein